TQRFLDGKFSEVPTACFTALKGLGFRCRSQVDPYTSCCGEPLPHRPKLFMELAPKKQPEFCLGHRQQVCDRNHCHSLLQSPLRLLQKLRQIEQRASRKAVKD